MKHLKTGEDIICMLEPYSRRELIFAMAILLGGQGIEPTSQKMEEQSDILDTFLNVLQAVSSARKKVETAMHKETHNGSIH